MPLHFVKIQWKFKVTAAPCSKKLEMDDPDCASRLHNKSHKLMIKKALSQARRMEILVSYSNRNKGSASLLTPSHLDKTVG